MKIRPCNLQCCGFRVSGFIRTSSFVIRHFLPLLLAFVSASALEPPPPYFDDAAQDGSGVVWALCRAEYNQLYAFDGKVWSERQAPFTQVEKAMPACLGRLPGGAVACVWRLGNRRMAITQHRGADSKLLAECEGKIEGSGHEVPPFGDSRGGVWITGGGPQITRADSSGGAPFIYRVSPEQLVDARKARGEDSGYNPICAVEDGRGRVWIWSHFRASNYASLRDVLIFDGNNVEQKAIHGIKKSEFSAIVRKDAKHMRVAVRGDGLYEVDIDTLESTREAVPDEKAFCCVQNIFSNEKDLYVITESGFKGALWRLRNGNWKRLIDEVDSHPHFNRAWLKTNEGLILCAAASPWLVREGTPPVRLDWQNGFPIDGARQVFRLTDGTLFALGHGGAIFHGKLLPSPKSQRCSRITEIKMRNGWTMDNESNVWWVPDDTTNTLCQWNGERVVKHTLPDGAESNSIQGVAADLQGRIWLLPGSNEKVAAFFDSRIGKWQAFPKIEDAYHSVLNDPPQFPDNGPWFYIPQFSADHRRIAFRSEGWQVVYFDGSQWKRWKRKDIGPIHADNDFTLGQPFFDAKGALCVTTRYHGTLQFDEKGNWIQTDPDTRFMDPFTGNYHQPARPEVPDASPTKSPESIVQDNLGATWLGAQGHLYKCAGPACVEIFSKTEPNPFTMRRHIRKVAVGRGGNVFLETASAVINWFMIAPKSPPPKTTIAMERIAPDSFKATLNANSRSRVQFRWRLDGESWQVTKGKTLALDSLPNGSHALAVLAIDEELQSDATPAVATFEVKVDPVAQVAALIKRLADPDFAKRESAIAALARQPAIALPALKAARESANDDQRWWIDAAVQEIERKLEVKN